LWGLRGYLMGPFVSLAVGVGRRVYAVVVAFVLTWGVLRLPAVRCGLRVLFSMCGARAQLSSSRSRGSTWVLTLGTRYAVVHLSRVVSGQVTREEGVGYSSGTSLSSALVVLADLGNVAVVSC
jgi:hypothetical protein